MNTQQKLCRLLYDFKDLLQNDTAVSLLDMRNAGDHDLEDDNLQKVTLQLNSNIGTRFDVMVDNVIKILSTSE